MSMKHLLLISVFIHVTCGQAYCDQASDMRELTTLVDDINAAVVKADLTFLERVLHKDYVHHGQHGMIEDRSQYLENRKTGRVDYETLAANDVKVRVYGDTAIVTYASTAKGKDPLGAIDDKRSFTRVFVRQDGRWQQVHSQATPIRLAAARPAEEAQRANSRDPANDERELAQLVKDLNRALVEKDIDFLERVLHQDYSHYRPRGTVENRGQYLENRKTGRVDFDSLIADEIKVRRYGDMAVVTYLSTAKGRDPQGAIDEQRLFTRMFVRRDGRWQLVHSQGTPIQRDIAPPDAAAQTSLQGTWIATKTERDGKAADDVVGNRLFFTGNRFQIQTKDGKPLYAGTVRLDPSAKPAAIDFEHTEGALKGKIWKGIYVVDSDTLTTCDNAPDLSKGRPSAFEANGGSGDILITFKRANP
jgi:uncharacterized protein (TIGR03067 family)